MPSVATIYIIVTTTVFLYTAYDQIQHSNTYFKAIMSYFADQKCVFILYNMILSIAILLYRMFTSIFFVNTMEGEVVVSLVLYRKLQISSRVKLWIS